MTDVVYWAKIWQKCYRLTQKHASISYSYQILYITKPLVNTTLRFIILQVLVISLNSHCFDTIQTQQIFIDHHQTTIRLVQLYINTCLLLNGYDVDIQSLIRSKQSII